MDKEFVDIVIKYLKLDSRIKETINSLKEMKQEKKQYEDYILEKMEKNNQDVLNISSGGSLRKSVSKVKSGLKQEYITQVLTEYTKDKNEALLITQSLMNNRPLNERVYLKRTNPRKKD